MTIDRSENLTQIASRGVLFSFGAATTQIALSLGAQVALGWLLIDEDFGVYALAIGASVLLLTLKDGGVHLWLARLSRDEFSRQAGSAFWLALVASVLVGGVLAAFAPLVSRAYGEPEIVKLMWVLSASLPLGAYAVVGLASLQVNMRFGTLAAVETSSALVRYSLMVVLAVFGFGPLSFVLPVVAVAIYESAACLLLVRVSFFRARFQLGPMRTVLSESRWAIFGSLASGFSLQADYLALGLVAKTAAVGVYYFAYQLSFRLVILFSETARRVLMPVFARVEGDLARQSSGLIKGGALIGAVAAPALVLFASTAGLVEEIVWQGRWRAAVPLIRILAAAMPIHLMVLFVEIILLARARFRLWTALLVIRTAGVAAAAIAGGLLSEENLIPVAASVSAYLALAGLIEIVIGLRRVGLSSRSFLRTSIPPYLYAILAGGVAFVLSEASEAHVLWRFALGLSIYAGIVVAGAKYLFRSQMLLIRPIVEALLRRGARV